MGQGRVLPHRVAAADCFWHQTKYFENVLDNAGESAVSYCLVMSRKTVLAQLARLSQTMVQGALSSTTRTCGKSQCPCHTDPARRHGPNLYLTWRAEGKSRALYVPPKHTSEAKAAQAAWLRFQDLGRQLASLNRDQMSRRWARRKSNTAAGRKSS